MLRHCTDDDLVVVGSRGRGSLIGLPLGESTSVAKQTEALASAATTRDDRSSFPSAR